MDAEHATGHVEVSDGSRVDEGNRLADNIAHELCGKAVEDVRYCGM